MRFGLDHPVLFRKMVDRLFPDSPTNAMSLSLASHCLRAFSHTERRRRLTHEEAGLILARGLVVLDEIDITQASARVERAYQRCSRHTPQPPAPRLRASGRQSQRRVK